MTLTVETPKSDTNKREHLSLIKATPAQRLLSMFGDWAPPDGALATSEQRSRLASNGYTYFIQRFGDAHACIVLRASSSDVIEVQTLIAYPDKRGHGTAMLTKLCEVADVLEVQLWLDAKPFGECRSHIPLSKLKSVYRSFGFFPLREPHWSWISGFHRWDHTRMKNVMLRNARLATE